MLIPFAILLALVIYLIYTRNSFEKNMVSLYESKFEEWKKHINVAEDKEVTKELAGLVFKKGYKVEIELLNESSFSLPKSSLLPYVVLTRFIWLIASAYVIL